MKKIIVLFLIFRNFIFSAQEGIIREMQNRNQEINREERRRKVEAVERFEKEGKFDEKYPENILNKNIKDTGSEIKEILIYGNTILSEFSINRIKNKYIGEKGGENVLNFVKELENLYLEKGYIATRVKIDMENSNFKDGKVICAVIEGYIENIEIKGEKNKLRVFTSFPVRSGKILNMKDLDQGIENLNSIAANDAKLDILAGKDLGGSIIEISNKKSKKISGSINYNNLGQKSTGEERMKFAVTIEDFLGINDSFTSSYQRKLGRERKYKDSENFSFYYRVPFRYWDISIIKDQSEYITPVKAVGYDYKSRGVSKNMNYSIRRILHRNDTGKTSIGVTLTNKESKNYIDDTMLVMSSRKLSVLKIDVGYQRRLFNGMFSGEVAYHEGLKRFGAERDDWEYKDFTSPKAQFQKYTTDLNWYKPFRIGEQNFSYKFSFSGQYSDDILYSSEKLSIGDDTTVRGFKENSIMGDKGIYIRNEIAYSYKFLEPFIAYDTGRVKDVTKDEYYKKYGSEMSGAAVGVRVYFQYLTASITYSKPVNAPSYVDKNKQEIYITLSCIF
ncbi:MAG: ShlB/FhaC/HecB family hemolysin secretion/activation protein [Fusobacterium varium]|uniref:ShlB/FhaC/HecB family hemolysin secretion/activation protein n=1 Tax=Fusobacterium varium TaxID=856 RepID=UPI00242CF1E7|nr:ShlB/FhaC/HecB family hemolysin secretion/activation protein [Fusobacterium varium]UYI77761.1 MAG: ShlB/FhaC/HecB family hemolysin secretion/activation protein [Fusobacterium varium]